MIGAETSGPQAGADRPHLALILVSNTVTHDSRVLREAATLGDLGFDVLIAGVVSGDEQEIELRVNDIRVIRLTRVESLKRLLRKLAESRSGVPAGEQSAAVTATGRPGARRFALIRRLIVVSAYYLQGAALVRRTSPAIVHANDYDTMWIGIAAKLLRGSRLVYDSHELWPDQGQPQWRPWLLACEWLFVRAADATVAANPAIAETMAQRYRVPPPIVVRNVPERMARPPARAEGLRAGESPVAVYVGSLTPERGIEQTIEALALVPDLRLRFMGYGSDDYRGQLDNLATEVGVADRIEYRPPVEPAAVADTIASADMGIVLTQPTCVNNVRSLPNKLFEYAAAGLPIVGSDLPVIGTLLREEGIGEAVPPDDVAAIAEAMRRLADPDRNAEVRASIRSFGERVNWEQERRVLEGVYGSLNTSTGNGGGGERPTSRNL
jgi:glycosyltransferase involved in cell wall biosynthesis